MKLTINTTMKTFKFRKVIDWSISTDSSGDNIIKVKTKKGTKALILPEGTIRWIRRD